MAVYGIGAMYGGTEDQTDKFIDLGVACISEHTASGRLERLGGIIRNGPRNLI